MKRYVCSGLLMLMVLPACAGPLEGLIAERALEQVHQLKREIHILQQQYHALQEQTMAVTGSYRRGEAGWKKAVKATEAVPGTWQDVVARQQKGEFAQRRKKYEQQMDVVSSSAFSNPGKQRAADYQLSADAVMTAMAGGEALYDEVNVHLQNIIKIGKDIDKTENIKDAQDMQNRLLIEGAMLQAAMTRASAMNMRLQASLQNMNNRAEAANELFYQWQSKGSDDGHQ